MAISHKAVYQHLFWEDLQGVDQAKINCAGPWEDRSLGQHGEDVRLQLYSPIFHISSYKFSSDSHATQSDTLINCVPSPKQH